MFAGLVWRTASARSMSRGLKTNLSKDTDAYHVMQIDFCSLC